MCIVPHSSISRWPVPSSHHICEQKVEIADKQAVLQYCPLSVPHICMFLGQYKRMDMHPIDRSNTIWKVSEAAIVQDLGCDWCINGQQLHVWWVEWIQWEKINHLPKIPANYSVVCLYIGPALFTLKSSLVSVETFHQHDAYSDLLHRYEGIYWAVLQPKAHDAISWSHSLPTPG